MTKLFCVMTRLGGVKAGWLSEAPALKKPLDDLDDRGLGHHQFYEIARYHERVVMDIMHQLGCRPIKHKTDEDSPVTARQYAINAGDVQLVRDGVVYLFNGVRVLLHPKTRTLCFSGTLRDGVVYSTHCIVMPKAWVNRTARYHNESDTVLD